MALSDLLLRTLADSGLMQYPDKKVYRAASQLAPEDRPTVRVRAVDPDPKAFPIFRISNPGAWADKDRIVINRASTEYQEADPLYLASVLAHEAQHYKTGEDEVPAYAKALAFLQSTRLRDSDYVRSLKKIASKYARKNGSTDELFQELVKRRIAEDMARKRKPED